VIARVKLEIAADKVALVTPLIPREENRDLAAKLKVPLNTQGFFLEAHPKLRPLDFATDEAPRRLLRNRIQTLEEQLRKK